MRNFFSTFLPSLVWPALTIPMFRIVITGVPSDQVTLEKAPRTTLDKIFSVFSIAFLSLGLAAPFVLYSQFAPYMRISFWFPAAFIIGAWFVGAASMACAFNVKKSEKQVLMKNLILLFGWTLLPFFSFGVIVSAFLLLIRVLAFS